ncbi:glycosyltransferase [Algoriphagus marincola]|uniref:Glycosyltransferase n=1 Tax=Algoriphagus marincola TaxID=264027 RepID=A0ABS7N4J2_9BACT|nr:glycosyltransferase [Algoriphagus marincola]MBY5950843.1 glycosyltransferase [Algoriphagus marincola]
MKLLFTQDALVNAGAERSHLEILSRFSEEVDVGFVYFYPKHDLREAYERAGFRLFFLDIPESYHFGLAVRRLIKLIRHEKPDLLVSSLWRADIITRIASWITGVPLVGTLVNDSYAPIAWTDKKGLKYKIVYWLDWLTSGIPVHWIANARALADSHVKTLGIDKDKISVVYRGRPVIARTAGTKQSFQKIEFTDGTASAADGSEVNSDSPNSSLAVTKPEETASPPRRIAVTGDVIAKETSSRLPDEAGADEGSAAISRIEQEKSNETASPDSVGIAVTNPIRNFISYGRLLERKGFQDAIQAFASVIKKYPDCTLTIFGEGSYRKNLEALIQELGLYNSVFLPGKIPNPMDILISNGKQHPTSDIGHPTSFHCFLFPSWYEGFSGALVEAMMAGIPIIASDIPMNLEAVEDQKTTLIFPVQDADFLAKQMTWAIENPESMQALGIQARKVAEERFDIEKIAKQYEDLLQKIVLSQRSALREGGGIS